MTSLRKRLDNILVELAILRQEIDKASRYPPCCLTFYKDRKISCDVYGPLPEKEFSALCERCRATIKEFLEQLKKT